MTYHFANVAAASRAYSGDVADRIRRFLPLVRRQAWQSYGAGRSGLEIEDLIQAGLVALTEAAQRHVGQSDFGQSAFGQSASGPNDDGFAAYAKLRVRGAMIDLFRRNAGMSRGAIERKRQLRETVAALQTELGRPPSDDEIADRVGLSGPELADLQHSLEPVRFESLDEVYADSDAIFADDAPGPLKELEASELRAALAEAVGALPERLQLVVQLYFVEELNLTEIAAVLNVSVPRVHQLKAQALASLKAAMVEQD